MTLLNSITVGVCLCPLTVGGLQIIGYIHYDYKTAAHEMICSLGIENSAKFTHFYVFKNLFECLSSVKHKRAVLYC